MMIFKKRYCTWETLVFQAEDMDRALEMIESEEAWEDDNMIFCKKDGIWGDEEDLVEVKGGDRLVARYNRI